MRLHRLELSAFGPFVGHVAVDCDALGADGLFLLHGETGAGKTTLLDAVAFALYGRVPGARQDARRLRCDRSDPGTATWVELEATIAGRRLAIRRSPEYERPKLRGTGTTTQHPSVSLRWLDEPAPSGGGQGGRVVAGAADLTRADEVGQAVNELIGMSAEQFFQVVLLPQGEFARFLRADHKDRQQLLERLFDTVRFQALEDAFAQRRRDARNALDDADRKVGEATARVLQAAGLDELADGAAGADTTGDAVTAGATGATTAGASAEVLVADGGGTAERDGSDWLDALIGTVTAQAEQASARVVAARTVRDDAADALEAAEARDTAAARVLDLRERQQALLDREAEHRALRDDIRAAERAAEVIPADNAVRDAEHEARAAEEAETAARAEVPQQDVRAALDRAHSASSTAAVRAATDDIRQRIGALDELLPLEADQRQETATLHDHEAALAESERVLETVEGEIASLPEQRHLLQQQLADLRAAAGRAQQAAHATSTAAEIHAAAIEVPGARAALESAEAAHRAAVDAYQQAVDRRQHLTGLRIAGMAAELAADLQHGKPCMVCGSTSHPRPATPGVDQVGAADIEAAQRAEAEAGRTRARTQDDAAAARDTLTRLTTAARDHDEARAGERLAAARADERTATDAAAQLPSVEQRAADLDERTASLAERRTTLRTTLDAARHERSRLRRSIAARAERLAIAVGDFESVADHRNHLRDLATTLERWGAAIADLQVARAAVQAAGERRARAARDAGFGDVSEAMAAATAVDLADARQRVADYDQQCAIVRSELAKPENQLGGEPQRIDLEPLARAAERASADYEAARTAAATTEHTRVATLAAATRLRSARSEREPIARSTEEIAALADVIAGKGQNARALPLRAYVLALKLQHVTEVASTHLQQMSSGRYRLVYSDQREGRVRTGGLGLEILDAYSGRLRPTKTLSGGESFLASLALALALADVVAAESGGRILDTIFIDEGFGSLDSGTLDLVMATLDELRTGGRVVGVVSHVDEMRQRIPTRLRVHKAVSGSTVEMMAG